MNLLGCIAPSLQLGGGCVLECRLLMLNLLAEGFDISFDFRLEAVPTVFQLTLGAQPSGLTGIGLLLNGLLEPPRSLCKSAMN
jgi:hypothetical protein